MKLRTPRGDATTAVAAQPSKCAKVHALLLLYAVYGDHWTNPLHSHATQGGFSMKIRLLGGPSGSQGSPRLYATDRDTFAVQGWKTGRVDRIEIPHKLIAYAEPGTCLAGLSDTGHGTFLLTGIPFTDAEALAAMAIPSHEAVLELPVGREVIPDEADPRR